MAEEEVATKAPESDAQHEPSAISNADTKAQSGPTMGEHCTTDRPLNQSHAPPTGEITDLNGVQTYISRPSSYPQEPGKLLLLLTGGTGLQSINNQLQADAFAARGFLVVMPDQFQSDAAPNTAAVSPTVADNTQSADNPSILERVKLGAAETAKSFMIDMWLARQTPEKVLPILHKVLEGAKETFADAVANGGGVYGVGYCVGGKYLLNLLGAQQAQQGQGDEEQASVARDPELKAGAIAHGAMVTKEDLEAVKRPLALVCVAEDNLFPDEVREQGKAALELNAIDHDLRVFEGVPHGFAVVGDYEEHHIQKSQAEAFEVMLGWLERH